MGNVWVQRPAVDPEIREGGVSYLPSTFYSLYVTMRN